MQEAIGDGAGHSRAIWVTDPVTPPTLLGNTRDAAER